MIEEAIVKMATVMAMIRMVFLDMAVNSE